MFDRKVFFDAIRPHVNLTTGNVSGIGRVLSYGEARGTSVDKLAYILATAWWETAQTMQPVKEAYWLSEDWRRRNLRYFPWYGRGLIQTTWEANYKRMGDEIGVDLTDDPDKLLQWEYSLPALFVGMEKGLYTGHSLDDHIDDIEESRDEDFREYVNARRIVNGTDKAATIATLAVFFRKALKAASSLSGSGPTAPEASGGTQVPENPNVTSAPTGGLLAAIRNFLARFFNRKD